MSVVVTGGSRGIGAATVERFASRGARVFFNYNSSEREAKELGARMTAEHEEGAFDFKADMRSPAEIKAFIDYAEQLSLGGIKVLVNNAGISYTGLYQLMSEDEIDDVLNVNLRGAMLATKYALPYMIKRHRGVIINVASIWGEVGASCEVAYSASKAGLIGFTKALAKEVGPSGIRVCCVSPGVIDTEMNAHLSESDKAELCKEIPLGRMGTPDEVAAAIEFLARGASYHGNGASYLTGITLGVGGGFR